MNWAYIVTGLLTLAGCFMIACRVEKMVKGVTMPAIFVQHALVGCGLFGGFVLMFTDFSDWSPASIAAGIVAFFIISLRRWRGGAPEGTTKPSDLDGPALRHVSGGKRNADRR